MKKRSHHMREAFLCAASIATQRCVAPAFPSDISIADPAKRQSRSSPRRCAHLVRIIKRRRVSIACNCAGQRWLAAIVRKDREKSDCSHASRRYDAFVLFQRANDKRHPQQPIATGKGRRNLSRLFRRRPLLQACASGMECRCRPHRAPI